MNLRYRLAIFFFLLSSALGWAADSPLSTGRWVRISVGERGLYVLTPAQLREMGFDRPERVAVFGSGGALLSEYIVTLSGHKLRQTPTLLQGGNLYFFGQGTTSWQYNPEDNFFHHTTNHYSTRGYYLLTELPDPLRMQTQEVQAGSVQAGSSLYTEMRLHELEQRSLSESGRQLYGESMQLTRRLRFSEPADGVRSLRTSLAFVAHPQRQALTATLKTVGETLSELVITPTDVEQVAFSGNYKLFGVRKQDTSTESYQLPNGVSPLELELEVSETGVPAYLDYYEMNLERELRYSGQGQLVFTRPLDSSTASTTTYSLEGADGLSLFVLDPSGQTRLLHTPTPSSGRLDMLLPTREEQGSNQPAQYLALRLSEAYTPRVEGEIPNQNILGNTEVPDLLIITTDALRTEAERLASFYRLNQAIRVLVVTQSEVFNELNGGTPDATAIRLLGRHFLDLYRQNGGKGDLPMQLLLFGDGAYDNRRLTTPWQTASLERTEFLLSYQSYNSLDLTSYTTDDYFGMLEDERLRRNAWGQPVAPRLYERLLDIGVGRFPVRSLQEARVVVDKTIRYSQGIDAGSWKRFATFVSDNGDGNRHLNQSLQISRTIELLSPETTIRRVYMQDYMRRSNGGKIEVPDAKSALLESLRAGTALVNYNGHGSPLQWADEQLLTLSDIKGLSNEHLPLWITATCDFANFDAPTTSAGEEVLLHPRGGGVALLSTTRVVWDLPNQALNTAVLQELYTPEADGRYPTLGTAIRKAKNSLRDKNSPENRLNFVLLGSPLLRLQSPDHQIRLEQIGGKAVGSSTDSPVDIHALEQTTLRGAVYTASGQVDTDFQGSVEVVVYDGQEDVSTIDNFNGSSTDVPPLTYQDYRSIIYSGFAHIRDGRYEISIIIPKDVSYRGTKSRINLFAQDTARRIEAIGVSTQLRIVPGRGDNTQEDVTPPEIVSLRLSGQELSPNLVVPDQADLYIHLRDASGINRSQSGVGHEINLMIDGKTNYSYNLNNYYTALEGTEQEGEVLFALPSLPDGMHTARLSVWDLHNNLETRTLSFTVSRSVAPRLGELRLFPSLIRRDSDPRLSLSLEQGVRTEGLEASLELFDLSGRCLRRLESLQGTATTSGIDYSLPMLRELPSGLYLLRLWVSRGESAQVKRVLKFQVEASDSSR